MQQVSIEAALDVYRKKLTDAVHSQCLMEARIAELEQENAKLRTANDSLQKAAQVPQPEPEVAPEPEVRGGASRGASRSR
ncbi:hypothetical protein [Streptomyces sp. NPDC096153]|uniref:hypothetical protein n=1 Tax=Streptomyces sp. NPDC096153 TaxID=3155548 RepID=UPI00332FE32C